MSFSKKPEEMTDKELLDEIEATEEILKQDISIDNLLEEKVNTEPLKTLDLTMTPNGQFFRIDQQSFLSGMMERLYNDRRQYKKQMQEYKKQAQEYEEGDPKRVELEDLAASYDIMQEGLKVTLNSAYGALGNEHFRFFDVRMAAAITTGGQLCIRWSEKAINEGLNEALKTETYQDFVPYIDTDSNYVSLEEVVRQSFDKDPSEIPTEKIIDFMDKICENVINPMIMDGYKGLADYINAYKQSMSMKREILADSGFWTGKKRYAMSVWDDEGMRLTTPEPKIMGLEVARSSTPEVCRNKLEEAIRLFLNQEKQRLIDFSEDFRLEFMKFRAEDIASPTTVRNLKKYKSNDPNEIFVKGTPIHVRGALIYNNLLEQYGLTKQYPKIQSGEKIKMTYLKLPNPIRSNVIAFPDLLPPEFELDKYIDNRLQYEKTFREPLQAVVDCSGWDLKDEGSLEDFMG